MSEYTAALELSRLFGLFLGVTLAVAGMWLRWGPKQYPFVFQALYFLLGLAFMGIFNRFVLPATFSSAAIVMLALGGVLAVMSAGFVRIIDHYAGDSV